MVLTVCTGSLLLAATQLLNGVKATTNKVRCVMAGEGSWGLSFFAPKLSNPWHVVKSMGVLFLLLAPSNHVVSWFQIQRPDVLMEKRPQYSHDFHIDTPK